MTFAELKCTLTDFDPYQKVLAVGITKGKFTPPDGDPPASIADIYLENAKEELLADLQSALSLNPQDTEQMVELDGIVDRQQLLLREALAQKQLAIALCSMTSNPRSKKYTDGVKAAERYDAMKDSFAGLREDGGAQNVQILNLC